ncbi:hypothetical protein RJ639_026555 [Escallonia herrerae]|uniref:ABC transporter domain-containing protein n=1 Tax=Escallonia herrerae TaxID=1293975 RepID=A0AA88UXH5_9ASTE|nr:hypothetical protein RJ639_026555 [Escallonia herrerae]
MAILKGLETDIVEVYFSFLKDHIWFWEHYANNCFILHGSKIQMLQGTTLQRMLINLSMVVKQSTDSMPFLSGVPVSGYASVKRQKPTTDDLIQVLEDVCLGYVLERASGLDAVNEWSSVLSLGEQQRLAFARLLLSEPYLVLLDESTSTLDEANEANLYRQIEAAGITYISVGHRRTLYEHHNKILRISTISNDSTKRNWCIESTNQGVKLDLSKQ